MKKILIIILILIIPCLSYAYTPSVDRKDLIIEWFIGPQDYVEYVIINTKVFKQGDEIKIDNVHYRISELNKIAVTFTNESNPLEKIIIPVKR